METEEDIFIGWQTLAYEHRAKSPDWYWALGIIAVSGAVAAFFFENYLFSVLILIGAFTMALYGAKHAPLLTVEIGERGVRVDHTLYPYLSLKSFWVTTDAEPKLMIQSQKTFVPYIVIPLSDDVDPLIVREALLPFIEEQEHVEPLPHRLMDYLGF